VKSSIWREPLLHFVVLGVLVFLAYGYLAPEFDDADPRTIVVSRDRLISFLQYRSRDADRARSQDVLGQLSKDELQRLIQDYVREEALFREAKAMQLDRNDYVARQRLIQQIEFVTREDVADAVDPAAGDIASYYQAHRADFYVAPRITFTHVYFDRKQHGAARAEMLARNTLARLNKDRVRFDEAPANGDRFLYQVNYVERGPEELASHFGAAMGRELFALKPDSTTWQGPFESVHGFHLVMLVRSEGGRTPPLEDVRAEVQQEMRRTALDARFEESVQSLVKAYRVEIKDNEFAALAKRWSM
jgi:parvulin-like peptidyl-prolyl isomerase